MFSFDFPLPLHLHLLIPRISSLYLSISCTIYLTFPVSNMVLMFQFPILVSSFGFTFSFFFFPATVGPGHFTDVDRDLNVFHFCNSLIFTQRIFSPQPNPQPREPEGSHFVWPLPFDLWVILPEAQNNYLLSNIFPLGFYRWQHFASNMERLVVNYCIEILSLYGKLIFPP